jgi:hypothetical protein
MSFFIKKPQITYAHKCLFEFPFLKIDNNIRPFIEVDLVHTDPDKRKTSIMCLLDSGATLSVLPKDLGVSIGIDFSELDAIEAPMGIAGKVEGITCYKSPLTIEFLGTSIITEVIWMDSSKVTPVIGRKGFFDKFDVYFKQSQEKITLIFHSTPECHLKEEKAIS